MSLQAPLATALAQLLAPLGAALRSPDDLAVFLQGLGWSVEAAAEDVEAVARLLPVVEDLDLLIDLAQQYQDGAMEAGDLVGQALPVAGGVLQAVAGLAELSGAEVAGLASPLDRPSTWVALAADIPEYLLLHWLRVYHPVALALLRLGGAVWSEERPSPLPPKDVLSWELLGELVTDPPGRLAAEYRWGGQLDHRRLVEAIERVALAMGLPARLGPVGDAVGDAYFDGDVPADVVQLSAPLHGGATADGAAYLLLGLLAVPVPDRGEAVEGVLVTDELTGDTGASADLGGGWELAFGGSGDSSGALGVKLLPDGAELAAGGATVGTSLTLTGEPATPWAVLGDGAGTRLQLERVVLGLAVEGTAQEPDLVATLDAADGVALVVEPADGDGFLADVLGSAPLVVRAGVALRWSARNGVSLGGQVGLELTVPLGLDAGPVHVESLRLALAAGGDGATVEVTATGSLVIGPFVVTVQDLGVRAEVLPAAADRAAAGASAAGDGGATGFGGADVAVGLRMPTGLGLGVVAEGVVTGGGFLAIDAEAGSYAGIAQLSLLGVGITAMGVLDTDPPDADAWSLLLALFIELPSIQLGFGFTLTGVGGLAGVNRTVDVEALQSTVRSGALDSMLFPEDPIADAPVIIDSLRSVFPPADGRYAFGPVLRIGWGTPTLIEAELGIVIALPDPITIVVLGSVGSTLPTEDLDLVALHLDVAGVIDAAAGTLSIDASLHDSHVVGFALGGDMALRASFGDEPSFLMALGGFHPGFDPPAGFPELARLSLGISAGAVLQVHFDCYMALTSNTAQFGAAFELRVEIEGFGIEGGTEFDALIMFSPFMVSTHVGFHIAITAGNLDLAGVWLDATVEGPNPWYVLGTARFSVLGIEDEIRVDERIGTRRDEPPVPAAELLDAIHTALADPGAWSTVTATAAGVVLAAGEPADDELVATPDSIVSVGQRVVPLGIGIDKVGDAPPGPYDLFDLEPDGDGMTSSGDVTDWFAPAYYLDMAAGETLSAPSFELLKSGIEFGGGDPAAGPDRAGTLDFEQILRDPELGDDRVDLGVIVLDADERDDLMTRTATGTGGAGFQIAGGRAALGVAAASWAATDRLTGQEQAQAPTWSACHQTGAARDQGAVVVPSWEVSA
jgi:hypothetical protein